MRPEPPKKPSKRTPRNPNGKRAKQRESRTAENLGDGPRAFRDRFVNEYLYDFNATAAYIRAGGTAKKPSQAAWSLKCEPYVAKAIRDAVEALDEAKVATRTRVLAGLLREANHNEPGSSHAARVGAWMGMAKILRMGEKEVERGAAALGGVMLVPETANLESWEARAARAQEELKRTVRE